MRVTYTASMFWNRVIATLRLWRSDAFILAVMPSGSRPDATSAVVRITSVGPARYQDGFEAVVFEQMRELVSVHEDTR